MAGVAAAGAGRGVLMVAAAAFLDFAGRSVSFPFLQARRDSLGCDALCQGSLTSLTSGCGLVGAAVIGRVSDYKGRIPMLWLGLFGSLLAVAINSLGTLAAMWVAVIPQGLLNQNFSVAKALTADYVADAGGDESARAGAIGKLGMALGLSFMVGPLLGTMCASTYQQVLLLSAVLCVASGAVAAVLPWPSPHAGRRGGAAAPQGEHRGALEWMAMPVLRLRGAQVLIVMRLLMGMAFHLFVPIFQVSLKRRFDFGPSDHARFMGMVGLVYALSQGFLAELLIRRAGSSTTGLLLLCTFLLGSLRPVALWTSSVPVMYTMYVIMVVALGVMNTAIASGCSNLADCRDLGGLIGVLESVEKLAGITCPAAGGLLDRWHSSLPLVVMGFCYGACFLVILLFFRQHVEAASRAAAPAEAGKKES